MKEIKHWFVVQARDNNGKIYGQEVKATDLISAISQVSMANNWPIGWIFKAGKGVITK